MIERECVGEEGWISDATFKKLLAVYPLNADDKRRQVGSSPGQAARFY